RARAHRCARPRRAQRPAPAADRTGSLPRQRRDGRVAGLNWIGMRVSPPPIKLSDRQRELLARVVEEYVETGEPVGSKTLVHRLGLAIAPSTVRSELAELERLGLLTHPHTSAGRVPTERGYRYHVDRLLERLEPRRPGAFQLDLPTLRSEVGSALPATTEML